MTLCANAKRCLLAFMLALGSSSFADSLPKSVAPPVEPATARDFYNAGTELLAAKKFTGAEEMLLSALAAQDERVQPPALYNLGQARFADGLASRTELHQVFAELVAYDHLREVLSTAQRPLQRRFPRNRINRRLYANADQHSR